MNQPQTSKGIKFLCKMDDKYACMQKTLLAKVILQDIVVNGDSNATPIQIQQLSQLVCAIVRSYAMLQLVNENVTRNMILYVKLYWKFEIGKKEA